MALPGRSSRRRRTIAIPGQIAMNQMTSAGRTGTGQSNATASAAPSAEKLMITDHASDQPAGRRGFGHQLTSHVVCRPETEEDAQDRGRGPHRSD